MVSILSIMYGISKWNSAGAVEIILYIIWIYYVYKEGRDSRVSCLSLCAFPVQSLSISKTIDTVLDTVMSLILYSVLTALSSVAAMAYMTFLG